ncbi:MAG: septum site-determining protein MinC [Leptolyngbyaceae cyanobacterium SM2_3_12]|nr:septum site-determining protein MinC [Leptolyngbyaceae cyanobacterium SM2_3_12]
MVSDSSASPPVTAPASPHLAEDPHRQVRLKSDNGILLLQLPPEVETDVGPLSWAELLQQLKHRLDAGERFWQARTVVHLEAQDRLLDIRQLQTLADLLTDSQLLLQRVVTSRRQTAIAAVSAGYSVNQLVDIDHLVQSPQPVGQPLAEPLYLQTTVRSGVEIRHPGTIVILGDANPGSALVAEGDILVWGRLRGTAHAGSAGNREGRIMALQMQATQLRIADLVARPPDAPPSEYLPEVAYIGERSGGEQVGEQAIRIALAQDFARNHLAPPLGLGIEVD